MKYLIKIIGALIIAVAIGGSTVFTVTTFKPIVEKRNDNEARFQCAQSSRYTVIQKSGDVVWYPATELYQQCLKEKNL